jgi:hypothetical protein
MIYNYTTLINIHRIKIDCNKPLLFAEQ